MAGIHQFLEAMLSNEASDLHLAEGHSPKYRVYGEMVPTDEPPLDRDTLRTMLEEVCPPERWKAFLESSDLDFAYSLDGRARYRANYYRHAGGLGAAFRLIPSRISTLEQLGMPTILKDLAQTRNGLILVTGPTGSGKSTTLAAVIDFINANFCRNILTIEEPIEFIHMPKKSIIIQREVGTEVRSFGEALHVAVHEDVDVVLVGEMRDLETIGLALTAAETGVLVFGTLHTNSAPKSAEVLIRTAAIASAIREGQTNKITSQMIAGKNMGMQLIDDSVQELLDAGRISGETAYLASLDKERFAKFSPTTGG